jgi:hypothetical protein
MCEHASYLVACIVFLYMKISVCFIRQAHLLAIVSKFVGGGDDSVLWLSFAQQKSSELSCNLLFFDGQLGQEQNQVQPARTESKSGLRRWIGSRLERRKIKS